MDKIKRLLCPVSLFQYRRIWLIDVCHYNINAPLELVLDNFTEVEHTPDVHAFGDDIKRMKEVVVESETDDTTVRIKKWVPKKLPLYLDTFLI